MKENQKFADHIPQNPELPHGILGFSWVRIERQHVNTRKNTTNPGGVSLPSSDATSGVMMTSMLAS